MIYVQSLTTKNADICLTTKNAEDVIDVGLVFFVVNSEHISHLFLVFLLLTLKKQMFPGFIMIKVNRYANMPEHHHGSHSAAINNHLG